MSESDRIRDFMHRGQKAQVDVNRITEAVEFAQKIKAEMLQERVDRFTTYCPRCKGKVHARLMGPPHKRHLHLGCETAGCIAVME